MSQLRIISPKGDVQLDWEKVDTDECRRAQEQFDELVNLGYYLAYRIAPDGQAEQIKEFDPYAYRIVMAPALSGG